MSTVRGQNKLVTPAQGVFLFFLAFAFLLWYYDVNIKETLEGMQGGLSTFFGWIVGN